MVRMRSGNQRTPEPLTCLAKLLAPGSGGVVAGDALADDPEGGGVTGSGVGRPPEHPPIRAVDRLGDIRAEDRPFDGPARAGQRPMRFPCESNVAVGQQFGGVVLAPGSRLPAETPPGAAH
jgi:hypothetical protein